MGSSCKRQTHIVCCHCSRRSRWNFSAQSCAWFFWTAATQAEQSQEYKKLSFHRPIIQKMAAFWQGVNSLWQCDWVNFTGRGKISRCLRLILKSVFILQVWKA